MNLACQPQGREHTTPFIQTTPSIHLVTNSSSHSFPSSIRVTSHTPPHISHSHTQSLSWSLLPLTLLWTVFISINNHQRTTPLHIPSFPKPQPDSQIYLLLRCIIPRPDITWNPELLHEPLTLDNHKFTIESGRSGPVSEDHHHHYYSHQSCPR